MKKVTISDLKSKLSSHIRLVTKGEEILVCDRNRPVARILPVQIGGLTAHERKLLARGGLSLPRKQRPARWPNPPGNIPDRVMQEVWQHEREGR